MIREMSTSVDESFIAVPGARLYLREVGTGTPIVVLHGGPDFNHSYLLPGMDGLELTRRLKADPATREITVLALTAYAMKGDEQRALAAGCDGYIAKPIDTRTLAGTIARSLEQGDVRESHP